MREHRLATGVVIAILGSAAAVTSCWTLSGYTGGMDPTDGGSTEDRSGDTEDGGRGADPTADAAPPGAQGPQVMTSTGLIATASGLAQQHHIVYAQHDARYWLFYIDDDTTKLKTKHSKNLADWTDGAALTLSLGSNREGRNFSVAYADLGETDVVHVVFAEQQGGTRRTYHTRATIASGAVSFGASTPVMGLDAGIGATGCDPDGPSLVVDGNGFVNVVSGWWNSSTGDAYCDFTIFRSQAPDLGGTWNNGGFGFVRNVGANGLANSHMIVRLDGAELLGGFDYGDFDLTPSNLMWTRTSGGSWGGGQMLFSAGSAPVMSYNDWSFCRTNTEVHVVRRKLDNGNNDLFEHKRLPLGNTQWIAGADLSADPGAQSSGVVLLRSATKVAAFTIAQDANASVRYAVYSGTSWSPWQTLVGTAAARGYLGGSGCDDSAHPTLIWTESAGTKSTIVGMDVSSVF